MSAAVPREGERLIPSTGPVANGAPVARTQRQVGERAVNGRAPMRLAGKEQEGRVSRDFSRRSVGKGVAQDADVLTSRVTHRSAMLTPRVIRSSAVAWSMSRPLLAPMTSSTPAELSLLVGRRSSDGAPLSRSALLRRLGRLHEVAGAARASAPIPAVSPVQGRVPSSTRGTAVAAERFDKARETSSVADATRVGTWAQEGGSGITRSR